MSSISLQNFFFEIYISGITQFFDPFSSPVVKQALETAIQILKYINRKPIFHSEYQDAIGHDRMLWDAEKTHPSQRLSLDCQYFHDQSIILSIPSLFPTTKNHFFHKEL